MGNPPVPECRVMKYFPSLKNIDITNYISIYCLLLQMGREEAA